MHCEKITHELQVNLHAV